MTLPSIKFGLPAGFELPAQFGRIGSSASTTQRSSQAEPDARSDNVYRGAGQDYRSSSATDVWRKALSSTPSAVNASTPLERSGASSRQVLNQEVALRQNVAFDLQLTTREGDQVTIAFDYAASQTSSSSLASTAEVGRGSSLRGQSEFAYESESSTQARLQVGVVGDLNEAEAAGISQLLTTIRKTIDEFLTSDSGAALESALAFDVVPDALSDFALNLSVQESITAVQTYEQVASGSARGFGLDGLAKLAGLDELAQMQRSLIETAKQQLQPDSAVRLVRDAVPAYIADALSTF